MLSESERKKQNMPILYLIGAFLLSRKNGQIKKKYADTVLGAFLLSGKNGQIKNVLGYLTLPKSAVSTVQTTCTSLRKNRLFKYIENFWMKK